MPQKTFNFRRERERTAPLALPADETAQAALARVLALPAVGSKRFLTTKADRSVTGASLPNPRRQPGGCLSLSIVYNLSSCCPSVFTASCIHLSSLS